jgi:hypothetical protein
MSPIHDQSYRRYAGDRRPPGRAWTVIAMTGIRTVLARKLFMGILFVAWIPFIVRAIQIYLFTVYPTTAQILAVDPRTFMQFIQQQSFFVFLVTVYVGAGLIARDRRANALQIYLSKPLLRMEYIGGKLTILAALLLFITLLPALLLVILQIAFSGSLQLLRDHPFVVPAVVLASLLIVIVSSFAMLALSSLSKSTRYVAIMYTGVIFFTDSMFEVMRAITDSSRGAWISFGANIENITYVMFRQPARYETPVIVSVFVLLGLLAVCISVLERRVRGVEIVK